MKRHYEILDGLRGTAALLVVVFHLTEAFAPDPANNPLHHAYLAVDFFFMLSGFVIGYAYDDRIKAMGLGNFIKTRLIRLHPLVLLGVTLGLIGYMADPFAGTEQNVGLGRLLGTFAGLLLLLPMPSLPYRWGETHSLNGPCWSLLQEYLINIVYALVGHRLSKAAIWVILIISGGALVATALNFGNLGTGWGWENIWAAPIRTIFPFFAGLLVYRTGFRISLPFAYPILSLVLAGIFLIPTLPLNSLYESACIILLFPLMVAAGAGGHVGGRWAKLSKFSGQISYPIYILHYPFIYIYSHWAWTKNPATFDAVWVGVALALFFIILAWVTLKFYDEPMRKWLQKKFMPRRQEV